MTTRSPEEYECRYCNRPIFLFDKAPETFALETGAGWATDQSGDMVSDFMCSANPKGHGHSPRHQEVADDSPTPTRWDVELKRTQTRTLIVEAPDPAARDAIAYGVMKQMDEGTRLSPTVTVVDSKMSEWERGNTGEIREPRMPSGVERITHVLGIHSGIDPNHFRVTSADGHRFYNVDLINGEWTCSCASWALTTNKLKSQGNDHPAHKCKHILAVMEEVG